MGKLARFLESPDEVLSDQSEAISNRLEESIVALISQTRNDLNKNIDATSKAGTIENKALQAQITNISTDVAKIPTKHPEQIKTDLSGLGKDIKEVGRAVQSIPTAKFPDMSNNFKLMEKQISDLKKKLSQRVHVFEIERDPHNELVKRIVVRTK